MKNNRVYTSASDVRRYLYKQIVAPVQVKKKNNNKKIQVLKIKYDCNKNKNKIPRKNLTEGRADLGKRFVAAMLPNLIYHVFNEMQTDDVYFFAVGEFNGVYLQDGSLRHLPENF